VKSWGVGAACILGFFGLWMAMAPALPAESREAAWFVLATGRLLLLPALLLALAALPNRFGAYLTALILLLGEWLAGPLMVGLGGNFTFLAASGALSLAWIGPIFALNLALKSWALPRLALLLPLGLGALLFFAPFALDAWLETHQGDWRARGLVVWVSEISPSTLTARSLEFDLMKREAFYRRFLVGEQLAESARPGRGISRAALFGGALLAIAVAGGLRRRIRRPKPT
jgi:hypothetical protein